MTGVFSARSNKAAFHLYTETLGYACVSNSSSSTTQFLGGAAGEGAGGGGEARVRTEGAVRRSINDIEAKYYADGEVCSHIPHSSCSRLLLRPA